MGRRREIDREKVLDSADAIILESEGGHWTLDAVAERAGISKGGLVYCFPTKDALLAAALKRETDRVDTAIRQRAGDGWADPARRLLALMDEALAESDTFIRRGSFLMTALVHNPELSRPARDYYRTLLDDIDISSPQGREIRQAVLAVEGLFLLRGTGLYDSSAEQWRSVVSHARATISRILGEG